jgi:wyosine [tRNA(Phe)-imidazoG37] synthetase (radical SAM superfamily)
MKVALPIWGHRLSPVLDFAHRLLVVEIKNGAVTQRWYRLMNPQLSSFSQAAVLSDLGIGVLICGSISLDLANMIRTSGTRIVPFITGEVEEILQAYLNNTLSDPRFRMPGSYTKDDRVSGKDVTSMRDYKYIFGPVPSRRFGRSLGIDLTPFKTCSLNCVFCQLGQTTHQTIVRSEYYPLNEIISELKDWIKRSGEADYITLSGSGEPTLHAGFGEILNFIKENSKIPTVVLTNGTLLNQPEVREAACLADIVKVSLSASDQGSYEWVNRPHPELRFEQLIEGQKALRAKFQGELWMEIFLISGMNSMPAAVKKIAGIAAEIRPDRIHLNTSVRPPAEDFVAAVPKDRLASLAGYFHPPAEAIADFKGTPAAGTSSNQDAIYSMLKRRPCTADEIAAAFGLHVNEALKHLGNLLQKNQVRLIRKSNAVYYGMGGGRGAGR